MKIRSYLENIEKLRRSRVLVLAATSLDVELLPPLFDALRQIGRSERLDVVIYARGGLVVAARRIALLLHEFTGHLSFIVPDRCESSGMITILAAQEIIASSAAVFSPVDPLLQSSASEKEDAPLGISAQDVRLFSAMAKDWFGLSDDDAKLRAMSVLCDNIFPTTLTSFYRSNLEVEFICRELLSLQERTDEGQKALIIRQLLYEHHSHGFPLGPNDLQALGLPLRRHPVVEDLAWEIARELRGSVGGAMRETQQDDWTDVVLATRDGCQRRRRSPSSLRAYWQTSEVE